MRYFASFILLLFASSVFGGDRKLDTGFGFTVTIPEEFAYFGRETGEEYSDKVFKFFGRKVGGIASNVQGQLETFSTGSLGTIGRSWLEKNYPEYAEKYPIMVLSVPLEPFEPAPHIKPRPVFLVPVLYLKALYPTTVLPADVVTLLNASKPTAVLLDPDVIFTPAEYPNTELLLEVLLRREKTPKQVL